MTESEAAVKWANENAHTSTEHGIAELAFRAGVSWCRGTDVRRDYLGELMNREQEGQE